MGNALTVDFTFVSKNRLNSTTLMRIISIKNEIISPWYTLDVMTNFMHTNTKPNWYS